MNLTYERLIELLSYNQETGIFTWIKTTALCKPWFVGMRAGSEFGAKGYRRISIDKHSYTEHRLAWFYVYKSWPSSLDHIDGDKTNNKISNLREATVAQNTRNQKRLKSNTSGYKGVAWDVRNKKWRARIRVNGKKLHLGMFIDPKEAHAAYCKAAREYYGEFFNPG